MQGVSSHHYKTCTSVMNWARWKLYWWTSTSLWACSSHLLQDLIELQVTRAPITSDSEVSLRDRDVMSSAKGRHCASALTDSSSSALPRIPNSSFLQPLHFKSDFFSSLRFISEVGMFLSCLLNLSVWDLSHFKHYCSDSCTMYFIFKGLCQKNFIFLDSIQVRSIQQQIWEFFDTLCIVLVSYSHVHTMKEAHVKSKSS